MSFHDEFVYPDETARRRNVRFALAFFVVLLAGLHLSRIVTGESWFGQVAWYWWVVEAALLGGFVWYLFARKQHPQIIISGWGLGGQWVEQRLGRMLKWHRIEKVRMEPGVIVVDFQPFDAASVNDGQETAELRLPARPGLSEQKLAEAISDYMPVEKIREAA